MIPLHIYNGFEWWVGAKKGTVGREREWKKRKEKKRNHYQTDALWTSKCEYVNVKRIKSDGIGCKHRFIFAVQKKRRNRQKYPFIYCFAHQYTPHTHRVHHTHHLNAMRKRNETKTETDARTTNKLIIIIKIALTLMNPVSDTKVGIIATTFLLLFHFHTNFQCVQWLWMMKSI